jgi:hypothetical protein
MSRSLTKTVRQNICSGCDWYNSFVLTAMYTIYARLARHLIRCRMSIIIIDVSGVQPRIDCLICRLASHT